MARKRKTDHQLINCKQRLPVYMPKHYAYRNGIKAFKINSNILEMTKVVNVYYKTINAKKRNYSNILCFKMGVLY